MHGLKNKVSQNPTDNDDKIEPKFHEGDWIVVRGDVILICDIRNDLYDVIFADGEHRVYDTNILDKESHLWTIADAKDGDVLCYKDEISLYKHDIKNCTKEETTFGGFVYHCCYDGKRFIMDSLYSLTEQDKMDIHPATKGQCDLLFTKIKESGYTWDSKKKELESLYKCEVTSHSKKGLEMTT